MLSKRQMQITIGLIDGKTTKEIAQELGLSVHTCTEYIYKMYKKIGAINRAQFVAKVIRTGIVNPQNFED